MSSTRDRAETSRPALRDGSLLRERAYVDGEWVEAVSGETFPVVDPATGEVIASVPRMGSQDVRTAIDAAERAYPAWRNLLAKERAAVLRRFADLMVAHADDLALLMALEQGKPLAEARAEILYAASFLEWFGEEGKRVYGDTIPRRCPTGAISCSSSRSGVTAGITPWNFPSAMVTRKVAPGARGGLHDGVKPAEQTPLSALALGRAGRACRMPPGVFSIVTAMPRALPRSAAS